MITFVSFRCRSLVRDTITVCILNFVSWYHQGYRFRYQGNIGQISELVRAYLHVISDPAFSANGLQGRGGEAVVMPLDASLLGLPLPLEDPSYQESVSSRPICARRRTHEMLSGITLCHPGTDAAEFSTKWKHQNLPRWRGSQPSANVPSLTAGKMITSRIQRLQRKIRFV